MRRFPLIAALSALLVSAGCTKEEAPPPAPVRPVLSLVVSEQADRASSYVGTVEPRYSSDLGFRILGRIVSRAVDVGDRVTAGTLLAALDPMALDLAVRSIEADLATAEARYANAEANAGRQAALVARNAGTQALSETANETLSSALATVTRGKAALAKAREQLSYTRLVADTDGIVTAVGAEVGQTVSIGQTVVTIARATVREAVVDIPDDIARTIEPGARFTVTLQIDPSVTATGSVREIAPEADATTRSRRLKITLDEPPPSFRLGTTVSAALDTVRSASIVLPASAIGEDGAESFVWIVDEAAGTVSRLPVEIGGRDGNAVRVAKGLSSGMRVVTAGVHTLQEGQAIRISKDGTP